MTELTHKETGNRSGHVEKTQTPHRKSLTENMWPSIADAEDNDHVDVISPVQVWPATFLSCHPIFLSHHQEKDATVNQ